MFFKLVPAIFFLATAICVQAADSLLEIQFIPLNSLTESVASTPETPAVITGIETKQENSPDTLYTAESLPKKKSVKTPYDLPAELIPLWESMSIRQKAAQMVMVYLTSSQFIIENEIGGVLITGQHLRSAQKYLNTMAEIDSGLRIPLVVATDQEGGIVNRLASYSDKWRGVPSALEMRHMDSTGIHALANKIGNALKELKINMNLAPVLDPSKDGRRKNSFMEESRRSWGNDTTNAFKVRAFVKGMSENGVVCVSKHFPGYDSWTNSDHQIAASATPKAKIAKNVSFFKTLANDIPVTMMSSVSFVRISSRPAVFEPKIVKMARDMSPETVILTDDLWGVSLRAWISGNERVRSRNYPAKDFRKLVRTALMAGNDMFMITYSSKAVDMILYLEALSKQSKYYRQRIEESSARILKMKYRAGIIK